MTAEEIEQKLCYLADRLEIRDVASAYCRGVDRFDREIVISVYHEDAFDDHSVFVGDRDEFWEFVHTMHGMYHQMTQHYVTNQIYEIDGNVAHVETYFFYAALNRNGPPFSFMGGRYVDKLEKRGGRWRFSERYMLPEWAAPAINAAEGPQTSEGGPNRLNLQPWQFEVAKGQVKVARDRSDPSYLRPLAIPRDRKCQFEALRPRNGDAD